MNKKDKSAYNNKIEATGNNLCGFCQAGCPGASFISFGVGKDYSVAVHIVGTHRSIVNAIDSFSHAYHGDFFGVRGLGRTYLAAPVSPATVSPLAKELRDVLCRWGAGKQKAPAVQPLTAFVATLSNPSVHANLQHLAHAPLSSLGVTTRSRSFVGGPTTPAALATFDTSLFRALNSLASGVLVRNTNVTYPMKAVLLITGLLPAFDSQVRIGLGRGGFRGMAKTRYLLPGNAHRADGKKITRLPFLLGDCWRSHTGLLAGAISSSAFPALVN